VDGSSGSVQATNAPRAEDTRSRSPTSPHAGQAWVRSRRDLVTRAPHKQCWDIAVRVVDARVNRPPAARHSCSSAAMSIPGAKAEHALPHNRNQVRISQSSTVSHAPWTATICSATRRARCCLASAVRALSAWPRARTSR
jgi:hypothetical protein